MYEADNFQGNANLYNLDVTVCYFYVIAKNLKFEPPAFVVVALCYQKVEKHFQFTSWSNVINVNEAIFLYLLKIF